MNRDKKKIKQNILLNSEALIFSKKINIFFNYLQLLKKSKDKYLIYGYGVIGKITKSILENKIIGFVDSNETLWNDQENIFSHKQIPSLHFDKIILSVIGREEEIKELLKNNYNIQDSSILTIPIEEKYLRDEFYQKIYVNATYSPWLADEQFLNIYNQIQNNTLVDIFRCYELFTLVKQASKLKNGSLIEIGVFKGGTGAIISKQAELNNINEKVYLCDTFNGVVKSSKYDPDYNNGEHKATKKVVKTLLQNMNIQNTVILEGIFPDDTGKQIQNLQFRFCHIDVDVYKSAKDIIDWIWPKMVIGGIIVYDDYGFSTCKGIATQVEEQINLEDRIIIHNLNGHAIIIKINE